MIEFILPYLPPLLWIGGAYVLIKATTPLVKSYLGYRGRGKVQSQASRGSFDKYQSALEMVTDMENALVMQMEHIADELRKKGVDAMQDSTYQVMINDLHRIQGWKGKLSNNPLYMALDAIGFPIVKGLLPDLEKAGKRILRDVV